MEQTIPVQQPLWCVNIFSHHEFMGFQTKSNDTEMVRLLLNSGLDVVNRQKLMELAIHSNTVALAIEVLSAGSILFQGYFVVITYQAV